MDSLAGMRFPRFLMPLLACAFLIAACGDSADDTTTDASAETTSTVDTTAADSQGGGEAGGDGAADDDAADLYFTSGEQFRKVERDLPAGSPTQELTAAAEALVDGPTKNEAATEVETATQIPDGTRLEDVTLEGGTAVVSVSDDFTEGVPADPADRNRAESSELDARIAQVTYTMTQFPEVKSTKIVAGGRPLEPSPEVVPGVVQARAAFGKPQRGPRRLKRPKGERSSSVRSLQARLAELKYLPKSAVDGVDGYRTQQAVLAFQSWRGLDRDGVVGPATQAALEKANPPRPHGDGPSKRLEVYPERGVTLLVKADRTKRAIHVSTGGPGTETPAGTFQVFRKELKSWSVPFQAWLPYASYFNNGIAFHEYPDVPTYPASHGCVRVPAPEAPGLYKFAAVGTTVIVF